MTKKLYRGQPSIHPSELGCVSLSTKILTKRGWLTYEQVTTEDETIGYDTIAHRSRWTRVTNVHSKLNAELWLVGHKYWHAQVTPTVQWWSETAYKKTTGSTTCPECGWKPRGAKFPERGVQVHRAKIHGLPPNEAHTMFRGEFVRVDSFKSGNRLRLAAPAVTGGMTQLTVTEVQLLAWLQGDGHIAPAKTKPTVCPECGWLPGNNRKPHRGPVLQLATSVAVHRAKAHNIGRDKSTSAHAGMYDGAIYQSKPLMVKKISHLLKDVPHAISVRDRGGNILPAYTFRLRRSYVTSLVERSGVMVDGPEKLVLSMSSRQRAAWLEAVIDAEGHHLKAEKADWQDYIRIAQVDGPMQEAIKLAAYLEGYRPTYSANSAERNGFKPAGTVGLAKPFVVPSTFNEPKSLGEQPVWAPITELGTWTAGLDGQVFLIGSSGAGQSHAVLPS
ncbi:hypothetical protein [Streptomyces massasporeus]|uniref:hypothetical protein n=1 Tax=Streptomyces massasporeus TaxID=67324 RepID=UPI001672130E|nr:hypothetical protein [Streptomyces massasporeus]